MRISPSILLVIFSTLILLPLIFCPGASEETSRHWLHGIEHKSWPGPVIAWIVGSILVYLGSLKQDATQYLGYLILIIAMVGAFRLC